MWASGRGSHDPPPSLLPPPPPPYTGLLWVGEGKGREQGEGGEREGVKRISDVRIEEDIWIKKCAVLIENKVV